MIHLLLLSREGRWARDPVGNQWVLKTPPAGGTNFCMEHPPALGGRLIPDDQPRWVARIPGAPTAYGPGLHERVVCQACADVQHPIEERA
jgi:hypothetical protein